MSENPYAPPQAVGGPVELDDNPAGIWRDGDLLVVRLRDPQFPPRCVKTNKPFDGEPTRLDLDWIPNHGIWLVMLGALGHVIAKSMFGKKVTLWLPVSQEWSSNRGRSSPLGSAMMFGGILCFVLGTFTYVFAMVAGMDETSAQWIMYIVFVSPLIAIVGVIYRFARHKPITKVRKMTKDHVWIDKINATFMEPLREWPG